MIDLTGVWDSEVIDPQTRERHTGQLHITQTGNAILSLSTPGWHTWHGYEDGDMLHAFYVRDGVPGILTLQISPSGTTLQGTWATGVNESGSYLAHRQPLAQADPAQAEMPE